MKSEHRHELRTNELSQWLSNLPQWTKENLRIIISVSVVVVLAVGSYVYYRYQKDVAEVQKVELTNLIAQLPQYQAQILQSQLSGFDNSYMLIQTADDLQGAAENSKNDQMAAVALIKRAEVLRMELHYRLGRVSSQDVENAISQAKKSYNEALEKASKNPSLTAMAKFGLGLCEEELGNFAAAEQIYSDIATSPSFEGTTTAVQAKQRLETMGDYQEKVVFWQPPKEEPAETSKPQIELGVPESVQVEGDMLGFSDVNLSGQ